jgi:hypothetical protein
VLPEIVDLQRRIEEMERHQNTLTALLQGTVESCRELAGVVADIGRVMQGLPMKYNKQQ